MIIIRIQDLVLLHKNLPKIPLKSAKCMPQCWKYSQICCDVALAGIEFGNWTCELCSESCILHSDYPLNRVNQPLYFVIFLSFVHRILTHANGEYKTLMALQTSWRLQRKTRHARVHVIPQFTSREKISDSIAKEKYSSSSLHFFFMKYLAMVI